MATICEELPPDGVLLIYLSGSGGINCVYFKIMVSFLLIKKKKKKKIMVSFLFSWELVWSHALTSSKLLQEEADKLMSLLMVLELVLTLLRTLSGAFNLITSTLKETPVLHFAPCLIALTLLLDKVKKIVKVAILVVCILEVVEMEVLHINWIVLVPIKSISCMTK